MQALLPALNIAAEVAIVLAAIALFATRASPRLRVLLYRCAFVIALAAPAVLINSGSKIALTTMPAAAMIDAAAPEPAGAAGAAANGRAHLSTTPVRVGPAFFIALWLAGAGLFAGRHFLSVRRLSRAFEAGGPPSGEARGETRALARRLGVGTQVALRVSQDIPAPCAFGWVRPRVLIPAGLEGEALAAVLAHELCHVRNRDPFWVAIGNFAAALHWFNPLIWVCVREHRADIELVCDDEAARIGPGVDAYARSIVEFARGLAAPAPAGAMMSANGLAARMRSLITREEPMSAVTGVAKTAAFGFCGAAIALMSSIQLVAAENIRLGAPAPGNGYIYLDVAPKVEASIEEIGAWCGDDAHCVFEAPLGAELTLTVKLNRSGSPVWTGCTPSEDGSSCAATVSATPVRVKVKAR